MNFETVSLVLNWLELGALLAILCRLGRMFELIASTQRELRRAIHHLGERRTGALGTNNAFGEPGITSGSGSTPAYSASESTIGPNAQDRLPQAINP